MNRDLLRRMLLFCAIVFGASLIVGAIRARTNELPPKWDTVYYLDMARNGLAGNAHLAAPFAYRPAVPLLVHGVSEVLQLDVQKAFRLASLIMCVVLLVSCFYFCRFSAGSVAASALASLFIGFYYLTIKWTILSGEMVDIYAYPLILWSFAAFLQARYSICLSICAAGLFCKEFLLLPMLTQAVVLAREKAVKYRGSVLLATGIVLLLCFVVPRLVIHVSQTFQDIDPLNNPRSLRLLVTYPLNKNRDLNILFYYAAFWLPVLLLLTKRRVRLIWERLLLNRYTVWIYLGLHFLLVMYGGSNLDIFVTYAMPVELLTLVIIFDSGDVSRWELCASVAVVIFFNRLWMHVPLPDQDPQGYLYFYGGYHTLVGAKALARMAEIVADVSLFYCVRRWIWARRGPRDPAHQNF